jgi:hypothetical protein
MESDTHKYRFKAGRPPKWETPDEMSADMSEYIDSVQENPFYDDKVFILSGGEGSGSFITHEGLRRIRIMSIKGFCAHVGCIPETLGNYEDRDGFFDLIKNFRNFVENSQIEMAAAGFAKENIIARLNGLADKSETDNKNQTTIIIPDELMSVL